MLFPVIYWGEIVHCNCGLFPMAFNLFSHEFNIDASNYE